MKGKIISRETIHMAIGCGWVMNTLTQSGFDNKETPVLNDTKTGEPLETQEAIKRLAKLMADGFEVIPVCNHHDKKGYCLGHKKKVRA